MLNSSIPYAPNAVCLGEYARSPMGLKVGDRVKIDVDVQRLEELQRQRDAWEPELIKVTSASAAIVCTQKPTGDCQLFGVISAKEVYVFVCVCLCVCWQDYAKTTQPIFTKFDGKVTRGLQKNPLDFGGNLDHVILGFGLW